MLFRQELPVLGVNSTIEIPNGASASTVYNLQLVETVDVFAAAAANAVNQPVFITPQNPSVASGSPALGKYAFVGVAVRFGTASTSGTLQVEKTPSGTAVGSGTNLMASTVSLSGTTNTVVWGYPSTSLAAATNLLSNGDSISLIFAGTLTNLANCSITIYIARVA